jgi:hydroxymethylpyrimidine pyrophosphatase-like HAD family hydrolase
MNQNQTAPKHTKFTLQQLVTLMSETVLARRSLLNEYSKNLELSTESLKKLKNTLTSLKAITNADHSANLLLDANKEITVDLAYEIIELEKDILFLEDGEEQFLQHLNDLHPHFNAEVIAAVEFLQEAPFTTLITDRDGTINNYCARYQTSVQSFYNALFMRRFFETLGHAVIITSAPLKNTGILDISVNSHREVLMGASKGREFLDQDGEYHHYPVSDEKNALLQKLNQELSVLLGKPEYEKFKYIGSGLQFKFGQTTVARQDINTSIEPAESDALLKLLEQKVAVLDPDGSIFRIEDTGKDVEIILTVSSDGNLKDFDKTEGVRFIADSINLPPKPVLVCGDTFSDIPLITGALEIHPQSRAIFVTTDDKLKTELMQNAAPVHVVSTPDVLVTALSFFSTKTT